MNDSLLLWHIAGVALGLPLAAFAFGWSVLRHVRGLDAEERFAASWGVSFAFLGFSEFAAFLTGAEPTAFHVGALLLMAVIAAAGLFRKSETTPTPSPDYWRMVGLCALGYAHLLCIQLLLPIYVGGNWFGDWWMHYDEALVFRGERSVNTEWFGVYTLASRTPLFNLVSAFVLSCTGSHFWAFQLSCTLLNCCFVSALYLVLRDLFGARAGRIGVVLASLNLWLLHNAWFTWPKLLVVYFLLLGLHFYLRFLRQRGTDAQAARRSLFAFWVCGLLGFLTHQVALVYLGALLLHGLVLAWRQRAHRPSRGEWFGLSAAAGLLLGPWYGWLAARFGLRKLLTSTPVTLMDEHAAFGVASLVGAVLFNVAASLVPLSLLHTLTTGTGSFDDVYEGLTSFYFSLLTGALTLSLCVFLVLAFVRGPRARQQTAGASNREWTAVWTFALLGGLGALCLHPARYAHGCAHAAFFPSAVTIVLLAWGRLSRTSRGWAVLICLGMMMEFLCMFWSHVWLASTTRFLDDPNSNWGLKEIQGVVFLHDCIPNGTLLVIGLTVAVQAMLVTRLVRSVWEQPPSLSREPANDVEFVRSRRRPNPGMIVAPLS